MFNTSLAPSRTIAARALCIRTLRERVGACRIASPTHSFRTTLHRVLQDIRVCINATIKQSPSFLFLKRSPNTIFSNLSNQLYPISEPTSIIKKGKWCTLREATPQNLTFRDSESDTSGGAETRPKALARKTVRRRRPAPVPSPDAVSFASSDDLPLRPRPPLGDRKRPTPAQRQARRCRLSSTLANTPSPQPLAQLQPPRTIWFKANPDAKAGTQNFRPLPGSIVSESTHTVALDTGKVLRKNQLRLLSLRTLDLDPSARLAALITVESSPHSQPPNAILPTSDDDSKRLNVFAGNTSSLDDHPPEALDLPPWPLHDAAIAAALLLTTPELFQLRCLAAARSLHHSAANQRTLSHPWLAVSSPSLLHPHLRRHRHAPLRQWRPCPNSLAPSIFRR